MPTAPTAVHGALDRASFHLLFLSEGFLAADKKEFTTFCNKVSRALFGIAPFSLAERRISISSVFNPSTQQGVGAAARNTAFKFTLSAANELKTREPARIITVVKDITPVQIGGGIEVQPPMTGADVWLNPGNAGSRAVCVVVREAQKAATITVAYVQAETDDPAFDDDDLASLVPFIAMSAWPTLAASQPQYVNPFQAAAAVLARALGVVCGLGDESELTDAAHETFDLALPDPEVPNLVTDRAIRVAGTVDVQKVPWKDMMSATRTALPVRELDHPAVTVAGETDQQEFDRYKPVREAMSTNVVLLRHPRNAGNPNDTSALTNVEYVTRGKMQLVNDDPHLIEGGGRFRRGIYRPAVLCAMRFEGSDTPSTVAQKKKRAITPFCAVCTRHLQKELDSPPTVKLEGLRVLRGPATCAGVAPPSSLAARIVADIQSRVVPDVGNMYCVEATMYRYEHFFREILNWLPVGNVEIHPENSNPPGDPWYSGNIPFPYVRGRLTMWNIWMNNLDFVKANKWLWRYAGLGIAGAIQFARLGCIANRFRTMTENDPGGKPVKFTAVRNLSLAEVAALTPGSVLQLWQNEALYLDVVRYVNGVNGVAPVFDEQHQGHSLFFMGADDQGRPTVADQEGTSVLLNASYRAPLTFRIAAQWYDALNVPPVPEGPAEP